MVETISRAQLFQLVDLVEMLAPGIGAALGVDLNQVWAKLLRQWSISPPPRILGASGSENGDPATFAENPGTKSTGTPALQDDLIPAVLHKVPAAENPPQAVEAETPPALNQQAFMLGPTGVLLGQTKVQGRGSVAQDKTSVAQVLPSVAPSEPPNGTNPKPNTQTSNRVCSEKTPQIESSGFGFEFSSFRRPATKPPKYAKEKKLERLGEFLRSRGMAYCKALADSPTAWNFVGLTRNMVEPMTKIHADFSHEEWECILARIAFDPYRSGRAPGSNRAAPWAANFIEVSKLAWEALNNPAGVFDDSTVDAIRSGEYPELVHPTHRANQEFKQPASPAPVTKQNETQQPEPIQIRVNDKPMQNWVKDWVQNLSKAKAMAATG